MENYIKNTIAAMYGLTPSIVESRNSQGKLIRKREYVVCRQLYYYFALKYNDDKSLRTIGHAYSQHHSTIIHAQHTINDLIETSASFRETVKELDYAISQHYENRCKVVFEKELVSCDSVSIFMQGDCIYLPKMIYKVEAKHLIKILEKVGL